jgi:hypothetical protein
LYILYYASKYQSRRKTMAEKTIPLYVEIPIELKEWLYAKARAEDRKVNALVRRILTEEQRRSRAKARTTKDAQ